MKRSVRMLMSLLITVVVGAVGYYVALPALNVYSQGFWVYLSVLALVFTLVNAILCGKESIKKKDAAHKMGNFLRASGVRIGLIAIGIPIVILLLGNLISATFFNAQRYANIITVTEAVFEEDMPEADTVTNIALMDSESASIIGNRELGALSNVVSQFRIGDSYTQINLDHAPAKVANLEYDDFFKWLNNRDTGVPGYVWVDPVQIDAKYVPLSDPMKYVDSAFFGEDLNRKLRFSYPTKIFEGMFFEIDEEGHPYYIVPCMTPRVGMFGAMDVGQVIIFDPVTGESELYDVADTPAWVDNVFDGHLAVQKYDWYGTLHKGYWNSVIGNKDCRVTTDDFGYIVRGDDVWYFTGVTSVSSDESNIGFLISNARTGEYRYYPVIGAEEYSGMAAAEGEEQEKGYVASFPSLINVSGEATYIMVLKDNSGIVKMYALVNVENYSLVTTGETQAEAKEKYLELLVRRGVINGEQISEEQETEVQTKDATVTVKDIRFVTLNGNSVVYLTAEDGKLYRQAVSENEAVMLLKVGDVLTLTYTDTDVADIYRIVAMEKAESEEQKNG